MGCDNSANPHVDLMPLVLTCRIFMMPRKEAEAERKVRSPSVRHSGFVIRVCLTLILTLTLTLTLTTPRNDDHVAGYWHRPLFRQNNLVCGVQRL